MVGTPEVTPPPTLSPSLSRPITFPITPAPDRSPEIGSGLSFAPSASVRPRVRLWVRLWSVPGSASGSVPEQDRRTAPERPHAITPYHVPYHRRSIPDAIKATTRVAVFGSARWPPLVARGSPAPGPAAIDRDRPGWPLSDPRRSAGGPVTPRRGNNGPPRGGQRGKPCR